MMMNTSTICHRCRTATARRQAPLLLLRSGISASPLSRRAHSSSISSTTSSLTQLAAEAPNPNPNPNLSSSTTTDTDPSTNSDPNPYPDIRTMLSQPTWSVRSLLPVPPTPTSSSSTPETTQPQITPKTLSHLLRLSALPQPANPAEEREMLATLEAQLGFVRAVRAVDTRGVAPLRAIRDETTAAAVGVEALRAALEAEDVVGHARRPRRRRRRSNNEVEEENWDVLGGASETASRYFVVRSGGGGAAADSSSRSSAKTDKAGSSSGGA